ncbi:DUF397 domain-containing protein [Streptomyces sp. NPDC050610]|uniref:DUF397 domain-containing protein n=1 Tax=Streptomyces sp. NPDC050610 TaxID=3157097 RepID=UPI0034306EA9
MTTKSPHWVKSSYSSNGGQCVEWLPSAGAARGVVPVRDSKNQNGSVLVVSVDAWTAFVDEVKCSGFEVT